MDSVRAKRRGQGADQLLRQRARCLPRVIVPTANKAVALTTVELSRRRGLQPQFMKRAPSGFGIEGRRVRPVADQVIALLIFHHAPNAATQVVGVADRNSPSLLRQEIKTLLRFKRDVATIAKLLFEILRTTTAGWILGI